MSTSTSDKPEPIITLKNVNLVFNTDVYRAMSWRDVFTRAFRDPLAALRAEHDRLPVAKNISFTINRGDRIGLIGVNGSGKTSLCRCIAGMYHPTTGAITRRGAIRAVFDTGIGIQPELTGRENARLLASLRFASTATACRRAFVFR
ncbi:MAG: ATP-binding cassette domain-containing protein [Deltaproteobacteria bacterium]|nr:ATP-binding cassette domain-containing protein [Deltaproteobacteria bacterium]